MSAIISYRNLADDATLSGSTSIAYPLANLQSRQLAKVWRSNGLIAPSITADLGHAQPVSLVALLNINSVVRGAGDCAIEYSSDAITWTSASFALPADAGALDLPHALFARILTSVLSKITAARYIRLTPAWVRIGAANFYEAGRLWIGDTIDIPGGCDAGWALGGQDFGSLDRSAGLQFYADRLPRGRILRMPCTGIDTTIAYGFADNAVSASNVPSFDDLINYAGSTGEVVAAHRVESALWVRRSAIYGHLSPDSLLLPHQAGPKYAWNGTIIEER